MAYKRLVDATKNFNAAFKGKVKPREMEPHWDTVLQTIEAIEAEIKQQGFVRDFKIYTDESDEENVQTESLAENNSLNFQADDSMPPLENVQSGKVENDQN